MNEPKIVIGIDYGYEDVNVYSLIEYKDDKVYVTDLKEFTNKQMELIKEIVADNDLSGQEKVYHVSETLNVKENVDAILVEKEFIDPRKLFKSDNFVSVKSTLKERINTMNFLLDKNQVKFMIGGRIPGKMHKKTLDIIEGTLKDPKFKVLFIKTYEDFERRAKQLGFTYDPYICQKYSTLSRDIITMQLKNLRHVGTKDE